MFTDSKLTIYTAGVEAPFLADGAASGPGSGSVAVVGNSGDDGGWAFRIEPNIVIFSWR